MTISSEPDIDAASAGPTRLNPATRVLWRGVDSLQFELGRRAVIIDGLAEDELRQLLGVENPPAADTFPVRAPRSLQPLARRLLDAGYLWTAPSDGPAAPPRLAAELAALRTRHPKAGSRLLSGRRLARVVVTGAGRIAAPLGALLAAAGVGHVHVVGSGPVRLRASMPGGFAVAEEGQDFAAACAEVLRRAAPEVQTTAPTRAEAVDLVVLTGDGPVEDDVRELLHEQAQAHLVARCAGDHLVVGPLVLPGLTSCLGCADRHRLDRDPAWAALAVQLSAAAKHPPPSDVALASLAASVAALHALAYLDGDEPASVNATVELELPDWRLRRRTWVARADCPCGATS